MTDRKIPRAPLILGLAGLIPFVLAAAAVALGDTVVIRTLGLHVMMQYGVVILAFMSGVLWGFSNRALAYVLSVIPALWAFGATLSDPQTRLILLITGFAGVFVLDIWFARQDLAPGWWLRLRLLLTLVVLVSLGLGLLRLTHPAF